MSDLRYDWYPIINEDFIDAHVDLVLEHLAAKTSTRGVTKEKALERTEQRKTIAKHLLSALYFSYNSFSSKSKRTVSVPKTIGLYTQSERHPDKVFYSFAYFNSVYNTMLEFGWIKETLGEEGTGYTRIEPINEFKATLKSIGLKWVKQEPKPAESQIILKDRIEKKKAGQHPKAPKKYKKFRLPTPVCDEAKAMAAKLYKYNDFITHHCIALNVSDEQLYEIGKSLTGNTKKDKNEDNYNHLDFSLVQLRRIFSRGSLSKGGRFYGGWWQSLPSIYRGHITIDDYKTVEVDYSNMALRIVYAQKNIDVDRDQDLYDIGFDDWQGKDDPRRPHIKTFVNALMNDDKGNYSLPKAEQSEIGISHEELTQKVLETHKPIADSLVAGVGLDTQFIDSQIAELVMHSMMNEDILVLPIHDSFIVRLGFESLLRATMESAFRKLTNVSISMETDSNRLAKHFGLSKDAFKAEEQRHKEDPKSGIVNPSELDFDSLFKESLMVNYIRDWSGWRQANL